MDTDEHEKALSAQAYVVLRPDRPIDRWRTCRAEAIGAADLCRMKTAVAAAAFGGDARWRLAAAGDASAAIGIALDMARLSVNGNRFDVAMTAVAVSALEGNAAACLVTSHVIRRLSGSRRLRAQLATSWLMLSFEKLRTRYDHETPLAGGGS